MTTATTRPLGLRENLGPFLQQLLQVFFVGLTIGLQRTVIPAMAETEFGVAQGSIVSLFAFVVSFGLVKGAMNFVSGRLSDSVGRRKVLIWGWLVALPIPFVILLAPSWGWIVAANVLLGVNQGFCWSMTVTAKFDIARPDQRGLATGVNEFAGYGGVAIAGLATGYLASQFDPRTALFTFGLIVNLLALVAAILAFAETRPQTSGTAKGPAVSAKSIFALVTWKSRDFQALSQAGSVEKFVDALMWALVPVYLAAHRSFPAKTLPEAIAAARAKPGEHAIGSSGLGSPHHIAIELLNRRANVQFGHVPYRGAAQSVADLGGGHIPLAMGAMTALRPVVSST